MYLTLVPLLQYLATCSLLTVTSSYEETSLSEGAEHLYTFQPSLSKYPCEMLHWPWCKQLQQLLANTLHTKNIRKESYYGKQSYEFKPFYSQIHENSHYYISLCSTGLLSIFFSENIKDNKSHRISDNIQQETCCSWQLFHHEIAVNVFDFQHNKVTGGKGRTK